MGNIDLFLALCGKPCQNNGTCIAFNLCNCLYTGFGGDDCTQPCKKKFLRIFFIKIFY